MSAFPSFHKQLLHALMFRPRHPQRKPSFKKPNSVSVHAVPFRALLDIKATFPRTLPPQFFTILLVIYFKNAASNCYGCCLPERLPEILSCGRSCAFFHKTRRTLRKRLLNVCDGPLLPSNFKISWIASSAKRKSAKDMNAGPKIDHIQAHVCERASAREKKRKHSVPIRMLLAALTSKNIPFLV